MTNYTVNCVLAVLNITKGIELFNFLQQHYNNNLDTARGKCWLQDKEAGNLTGLNSSAKFIGFWATFSSQEERDLVYNTINSYKQYCLMDINPEQPNVEYQIIQRLDTGSPTFGDPLEILDKDQWGMMC